jgi:hypothetical protein
MAVDAQEFGTQIIVPQTKEMQLRPPWSRARAERMQLPAQGIDDEYHNTHIPTLKIAKPIEVVIQNPQAGQRAVNNFDNEVQERFNYFSRTRGVEVGTERVALLQRYADKMAEGELDSFGNPIHPRVVILNKGEGREACVYPEGTIFISQSTINQTDNLDELVAIVGHEVGHLKNNTFERAVLASNTRGELGVGWIHEMSADAITLYFQQKVGLNSTALNTVIRKLSSNGRDLEHQAGLARSSQVVGAHAAVDSVTSHIPFTEKPLMFERAVTPTNIEVAKKMLLTHTPEHLREVFQNLHPNDLRVACKYIEEYKVRYDGRRVYEEYQDLARTIADEIITDRLLQAGFSEQDAQVFIFYQGLYHQIKILQTPDQLVPFAQALVNVDKANSYQAMYQQVFEESENQRVVKDFLVTLSLNMHDVGHPGGDRFSTPVTREALLDTLEIFSQAKAHEVDPHARIVPQLTDVVFEYIERTFIKNASEDRREVDKEQIRELFEEVKARGIDVVPHVPFRFLNPIALAKEDHYAHYRVQNRELVAEVFKEVYGIEVPTAKTPQLPTVAEVDRIMRPDNPRFSMQMLDNLKKAQEYFNENGSSNAERQAYVAQLLERLNTVSFTELTHDGPDRNYGVDIRKYLEGVTTFQVASDTLTPEQKQRNDQLYRFYLGQAVVISLFREDCPEFYQAMGELMRSSDINTQQLNSAELTNLLSSLMAATSGSPRHITLFNKTDVLLSYVNDGVGISNYQSLLELPFMHDLVNKQEPVQAQSIAELTRHVQEKSQRLRTASPNALQNQMFSDQLQYLLFAKEVRPALVEILRKGVQSGELADLHMLVSSVYPDGVQKTEFLRQMNRKYLETESVSLVDKVAYLRSNPESVGKEGYVILANQIHDMETYAWFRVQMKDEIQGLLQGSEMVTKVAMGDFATSFLSGGYAKLFDTAQDDPKVSERVSTQLAAGWLDICINRGAEKIGARFDPQTKKFAVGEQAREHFTSFADTVKTLKALTPFQRFAVVHKALTDQFGALTSESNRKELAQDVTTALKLPDGFVKAAVSTAITDGDEALISFPASQMLAPLIFRGLAPEAVNVDQIANRKVPGWGGGRAEDQLAAIVKETGREGVAEILKADTRELLTFGARYEVGTVASDLAQQSDRDYHHTTEELRKILGIAERAESEVQRDSTEAVLKGVEASGPMGVRSLQLAVQLHNFSPRLERRLSESLDGNPGMEKLRFLENTYVHAEKDPELQEFLKGCYIGDYLGGGSLFTTYGGKKEIDGQVEELVLKVANPNGAYFVGEAYKLATTVLDKVSTQKGLSRKERGYASTGKILVDLANQWCLADLNDQTFLEDDAVFRDSIKGFNQAAGVDSVYAPKVLFNSQKVKSEQKARGKTVNQLLKDDQVLPSVKRETVRKLGTFFKHQLKTPITDDSGKEVYYMHSDPQIGNYITESTEAAPLAVIDRSMYLKLEKEDAELLNNLIEGQDYRAFLSTFVDRVLDLNKVRGNGERSRVMRNVFLGVIKEYALGAVFGRVDNFGLLKAAMIQIGQSGLDIPLNLRLGIRNVGAMHGLTRRQGLDLANLELPPAA